MIGLGIEIVDLEEFRERWTDGRRTEWFTEGETGYADSQARSMEHFAARFAAKNAAKMALGEPDLDWREIEVVRGPTGSAGLEFSGSARAAAERRGVQACHLSLSHTRRSAAAVVILS